jgi:hypothetical protein
MRHKREIQKTHELWVFMNGKNKVWSNETFAIIIHDEWKRVLHFKTI